MFGHVDAVLVARVQFAFTVSFHILFPAFTIGLASFLAVVNGLRLWAEDMKYLDLFRRWAKIFALAVAMGVVSGTVVTSYQFGTSLSVFFHKAGPVIGGPMADEGLSAFFFEAGFWGACCSGGSGPGRRCR